MSPKFIPAHCSKCDATFPYKSIIIENATNVTISGGKTICPFCLGPAKVADGTYDAVGRTIHLVDGPTSTKEMLAELSRLAADIYGEKKTPEEAIKDAYAIDSDLGDIASKVFGDKKGWKYGAFVIMLIFLNKTSFDFKIDINDLYQQILGSSPQKVYELYSEKRNNDISNTTSDDKSKGKTNTPSNGFGEDNIKI